MEPFEQFFVDEWALGYERVLPGLHVHLLKGDRGDREGQYLLMYEFDSAARRDELAPTLDSFSEESQGAIEANRAVAERWASFAVPQGANDVNFTDYIVIE